MSSRRKAPLIFVVDDDIVTSQMIKGLLARTGYQVACAENAASALEGICHRRPDLVLLDVNLPDASGLDVCQQLQNGIGGINVPVLFISGDGDVASKVKGFEAGGVDYIPKPFAGEEVIARVNTHLRLKQASEALADLQAETIQQVVRAQETLMPNPEDLPEARFEVCLRQAHNAGGDFYDVIPVGEEVMDYVVADASGHDLSTSFWTTALKTLLNEYATLAEAPVDVLRSINYALRRILPAGVYFTLIYARLNRQTGKLLLVNAAHPPAAYLARGSNQASLVAQRGDVIGAFPDVHFGTTEVRTERGDRVFLLSDGLLELSGSREEGQRQFLTACSESGNLNLRDAVRSIVATLTSVHEPFDDTLLLGVEV